MPRIGRNSLMASALLLLSACAFDLVHVEHHPATLAADVSDATGFELRTSAEVDLGTGYRRTLRRGTRWMPVGALPQGVVYRTDDQVLTVEGSNIYEAYIVVRDNRLVGFYLPANSAYTALAAPVALNITTAVNGGTAQQGGS